MKKVIDVTTGNSETVQYSGKDVSDLAKKIAENLQQSLGSYFDEDSPIENFDIRIISSSADTVFLTQQTFSKKDGEITAVSTGCLFNTCRGAELYKRLATNTHLILDSVNTEDLSQ